MRLLIAGGGTGGHIYPALAVARSLRDRPNAPDLVWLGGHRGLEAALVRAAGIPVRRLALRSLRSVDWWSRSSACVVMVSSVRIVSLTSSRRVPRRISSPSRTFSIWEMSPGR